MKTNALPHLEGKVMEMRMEVIGEIKAIHCRLNEIDRRLSRLEGRRE
ncbi:MAG: hypothetical protein DDT29_02584 [Dehalococcoidia bacterium]|nr:hypothetical protein [Bacillota bacterium]